MRIVPRAATLPGTRQRVPEAVRLITAFAWVGTLTFWAFWQYGALLYFASLRLGTPLQSTILSSAIPWLWAISFFAALGTGAAWYAFFPFHAWSEDAFTRVELLSGTALAICLWSVVWKITPIGIMAGICDVLAPAPLLAALAGYPVGTEGPNYLAGIAAVACLGAVVTLQHAWRWTRRYNRQVPLLVFFLVSLTAGLSVPLLGLFPSVRGPVPRTLVDLPSIDGRELREYPDTELREMVDRFLLVRDDHGCTLSTYEARVRREDEYRRLRESGLSTCLDTCQLPLTVLRTFQGLTLALSDAEPNTAEPRTVLELPLSKQVKLSSGSSFAVLPLEAVLQRDQWDDWLILKIDADVSFPVVENLLLRLRGVGVRRITLAALPYGRAVSAGSVAKLVWKDDPTVPQFQLESSATRSIVASIVTRRSPVDPPPECQPRDRWGITRDAFSWKTPRPGALPAAVSVAPEGNYQNLIVWLDRAIAGGAQTIYVVAPKGEPHGPPV